MPTKQAFKVGLVQMAMSARPEDNVLKAVSKVREAATLGAEVVCLPEMYRTPYLCQVEDHANFALAETVPGPSTEALSRVAKDAGVAVVVPVFERRAPGVYHNSAVDPRRGRLDRGPLPQDAHPGRPALLREILLRARRPRLPGLRREARPHRHPHLLGPVVPGGRAAHRAAGRLRPLLPDRDRVAPEREGRRTGSRSARPGRRSSARTRSRTASTSRR